MRADVSVKLLLAGAQAGAAEDSATETASAARAVGPAQVGPAETTRLAGAPLTAAASLRALLLKRVREQQAQAIAEQQRELSRAGKRAVVRQPRLTDDDWVFEQATTMLWNPLVGPDLRAALYKVLADTPGVRVNSHAWDDLGRVAVEISRTATATGIEDQTFENPKTGAVLETAFVYKNGTKGTDLYLSVTSRRTVPPNPYRT